MEETASQPNKVVVGMLGFAILLLSLYDFYFPQLGLPIFPIGGTFLFLAATYLMPRALYTAHLRRHYRTILGIILLILFFLASFLWGQFYWGTAYIKAPLGIIMGMLIFLAITLREESDSYRKTLYRLLNLVLALHLLCWLIQFLGFFATGSYLDYIQPFTGVRTRNFHSANEGTFLIVYRFTGLFAEPAIYSTFAFMGLTLRLLHNRYKTKLFDWLLMGSIVCSLSIYGYVLLLIFLLIFVLHTRYKVLGILIPTVLLTTVGFLFYANNPKLFNAFVLTRVSSPMSDASGVGRYSGVLSAFAELPDDAQVLGLGLGNYDMTQAYGNGFGFLLVFFGIAGTLVCVVIFMWLLSQRRTPSALWLFIIGIMFGAPLITSQYWWLWLGACVVLGQKEEVEPKLVRAYSEEALLASGLAAKPTG